MSYKVEVVTYTCDGCGLSETVMFEHYSERPDCGVKYKSPRSPEVNCPICWEWESPAEHARNKHYCNGCADARERNKKRGAP